MRAVGERTLVWHGTSLSFGMVKVMENGEWRTDMRILEVDLRRLVTYWSWQMRESDLGVLWMVDNLCAREDK